MGDYNVTVADFAGKSRICMTDTLYQYDYGQKLQIDNIPALPQTYEAHFSNVQHGGVSITVTGMDGIVDIPNALLMTGKRIYCWIYVTEPGSGETEYQVLMPVQARPMPEYYDVTDTGAFDSVVQQVGEYAATATAGATSATASAAAAATSASEAAASASAAETAKNAAETAQGKAEDAQTAAETAAQTATQKAQQTAQDAAQAAQSKADAESAAQRAEAAQTGAESAKTDAETAEQGAADSASAASASATSAGQAATSAGQSATAAAGSATTAGNAAQTATTKAGEASASASAAAASETAAQSAQSAAETAASTAAANATTATTKAAEAAQSASSAAQSKTDAEAAATRAEQAAASLTVDSALSDSSVNPVQNKVITGEVTQLKSAIEACEAGTTILRERGYFPDGYKVISDKHVGTRYYDFDLSQNTFKMDFDATGTGTMTVGVNLGDSGIALADSIVRIADYPVVKLHTDTNVPSGANLHFRIFTYQANGSTLQHNWDVAIPQGEADHTIDVAQKIADMHWGGDVYYRVYNITSDSYAYSIVPYVHSTNYGFLTTTQAENYNLALKYENLETRLSSAEEITEKAVTAIGEINLADETKTIFAQLDSNGAESAASARYQQISTDFIPVDVGVLYTLQLWAKDDSEGFWARVCFYNSSKVYVSRNDIRAASGIDHGYQYYVSALTIENGIAYVRISLTTYGDGRVKLERGNAVSDWTPGLGSVINGQVWNDVLAHSIVGVIHRGCGEDQTAPENTIPGFIWGKKAGFDFCETDIRYTSDGVAVLLHDASINRTARNADGTEISGTVNIADITYAQALTYDFGIYKGAEYAGTKIPTLEEFIVLCKNIELHPYLELKAFQNVGTNIPDILSMLDGYGMLNHVSWTASAYGWLFNIRRLYPHADLSLLTDANYFDRAVAVLNALKTPSNSVAMSIINAELTAERIQTLKDNGILISAYCPNTVSAMLAVDESVTIVTSDKLNYETVRKDSILGTQ